MIFSASKSLFKITEFFRRRKNSVARLSLYATFWYLVRLSLYATFWYLVRLSLYATFWYLVRLFYFGGCCHDHLSFVVGFTTTYAISAYQHQSCEFEPYSCLGVLYTTLCDKVCQRFATGWWFSPGTPVLNAINQPNYHFILPFICHIYNIF